MKPITYLIKYFLSITIITYIIFVSCGKDSIESNTNIIINSNNSQNNDPEKYDLIPPDNVRVTYISENKILILWDSVDHILGYKVYRKLNNGLDSYRQINNQIVFNTSTYDILDIPTGTTLSYIVTSVDTTGNESIYSSDVEFIMKSGNPSITIDGIKDNNWILLDTDPVNDAPFDTPQSPEELINLYAYNDTNYLYFGFNYYKCRWDDGVHFGLAIDFDTGGYKNTVNNDPWKHNGIIFTHTFAPEVLIYLSMGKEGLNSGIYYSDYQSNIWNFNHTYNMIPDIDYKSVLLNDTQGWIEIRIDNTEILFADYREINVNIWSSQQNQNGASDAIPGTKDNTIKHSDNITFTEYAEYAMQ